MIKQKFKIILLYTLHFPMLILYSQENATLFQISSEFEINFDTSQKEKFKRMILNPMYLEHYFVRVNDIASIHSQGEIDVQLPGRRNNLIFKGQNVRMLNNDNYVFYGETDPCDQVREGSMHLIAKNGNIFGQINIEDDIYDLQDFGDRKNVLFKINPEMFTASECATPHNKSREIMKKTQMFKNSSMATSCDVRVLVLYTPAAELIGNPNNCAILAIQQSNQIAANSDVSGVNFVLAGVKRLNGFQESQSIFATRDNLRVDPSANQLREDYQADIVMLLTDGNFNSNSTFGIAYLDQYGNPDYGYALAEIDAANGRYTFTHEIGHLFGCKHDNDNRGAADGFTYEARGHLFKTGIWPFRKKRRTVMKTMNTGSRIMHFSNPDVNFKGKASGVIDERENADQLSIMACMISEYRDYIPPFGVNISGTYIGDNSGTYTWCADLTSCNNATSVEWEYSIDGFNFYSWNETGNCIAGSLPLDSDMWLRVTVICEDGQTATDWHHIRNTDKPDPCERKGNDRETGKGNNDFDSGHWLPISIYPNPMVDKIHLRFTLNEKGNVCIKLRDLSGRFLDILLDTELAEHNHHFTYDISHLRSGYYLISINTDNVKYSYSIIKNE